MLPRATYRAVSLDVSSRPSEQRNSVLSTLASPLRRADTNAAIPWGTQVLDVVTPLRLPGRLFHLISSSSLSLSGFPGGSVIKKKKICLPMQEVQVQLWAGKMPWIEKIP